jgi:hypothetical protein
MASLSRSNHRLSRGSLRPTVGAIHTTDKDVFLMSAASQIVLACACLAGLSGLVLLRLLWVRVHEMNERHVGMQQVSTSQEVNARLSQVQASDNFRNLFEMPVLFYAWCAVLLATQQADPDWALAAWVYVALRCVHSFIQCGPNQVTLRFLAFILSSLWLLGMWGSLAWVHLQRG